MVVYDRWLTLQVVVHYRRLYITGDCMGDSPFPWAHVDVFLTVVIYYRWLYITGVSILQVIAWVTVHTFGHMWMFSLLWLYITGDHLGDSASLLPHVDVFLTVVVYWSGCMLQVFVYYRWLYMIDG